MHRLPLEVERIDHNGSKNGILAHSIRIVNKIIVPLDRK
jgi:hypothetical protein